MLALLQIAAERTIETHKMTVHRRAELNDDRLRSAGRVC